MKIAIIVAMDKELKLLLPLLEKNAETTREGYMFHTGRIGSNEITVMKSGIGKVNAALAAKAMIDLFHPDLVINTGVAGGIGSQTHPLDVVVGVETAYHDVWCGPGTEYGQPNGCPSKFMAPDWILKKHSLSPKIADGSKVLQGTIASGDIFISKPEEVAHINVLYPEALAVDMESAAIAQTCFRNEVDFIAIRVISDTPGSDDNISQYKDFWEKAPQQTFNILKSLLNEMN